MPPKPELAIPVNCEERIASNVYSGFDVYKALSGYLEEALPKAGFQLDYTISNIRIALLTIGVASGLYAHFGNKFPKDQLWIAFYAIFYFAMTGIVYLIDFFVVKSSCLAFTDKSTSSRVFLDVDRPTTDCTVTLRLRSPTVAVSSTIPLGKFFNSDGSVEQKAVFTDFQNLYRQLKEQAPAKPLKKD